MQLQSKSRFTASLPSRVVVVVDDVVSFNPPPIYIKRRILGLTPKILRPPSPVPTVYGKCGQDQRALGGAP